MKSTKSTGLFTSLFFALTIVLSACTQDSSQRTVSGALNTDSNQNFDYVVDFSNVADAKSHALEVTENGGQVIALDKEGRVLHVKAAAGTLNDVNIPNDTLISNNTEFKINRPTQDLGKTDQGPGAAESFLTARKVVGVDDLVARVPEADGRATKVAVFDTGIDFGVEGLFKHPDGKQKLVGFYDTTDFGLVNVEAFQGEIINGTVTIGSTPVKIESTLKIQKVLGLGIVDELELAKKYLAGEGGIDIDSNGKFDDKFPILLGLNQDGNRAVYIDANRDGQISDRSKEELTDFNTTFKYIDLRPEISPSGARALAVTIGEGNQVQFHSVIGGHGTSCAIIIAGDGYANGKLRGMAPKADLVGFVLDVTGQDVYTLDQFTKMFLKAKEIKVDAISISWGFATADLNSARFVADFLDREISSAGIVIGIAAGNEGPGISTAAADDYVPHNGFGVGAHISVDQARNVYGWTGATEDSVVFYSSFGPTRGGRQVPDVVSPLITMVRGERGVVSSPFYGFSGTSSATPALIGATTALISAIKAKGEIVDMRLLKLAIQQTATPVNNVIEVRQGAGLINVNAAFEAYLKLIKEFTVAKNDPTKKAPFAIELRASTQLENQTLKGEGVHFKSYRPSAVLNISVSEESKKFVDPLTFFEPLNIVHSGKFIIAPNVLAMQANGAGFSIAFDQSKMTAPGAYTDVVKLVRPSDGLVLLRIPVVVEVPALSSQGPMWTINQTLTPFDTIRMPIRLETASPIVLQGVIQELSGGERTALGLHIVNKEGIIVADLITAHSRTVNNLEIRTENLPADDYEVVIFRSFGRPSAVLNKIQLTATVRVPFATIIAARQIGQKVEVALRAEDDINVDLAKLTLEGRILSTTLSKMTTGVERPGFYGEIDLGKSLKEVALRLKQNKNDKAIEGMLHMSVALVNKDTGVPSYRGWNNVVTEDAPLNTVELTPEGQKFQVIAYPNIVNWPNILTEGVTLEAGIPLETEVAVEQKLAQILSTKQVVRLLFDVTEKIPASSYGVIELKDPTGVVLEKLPVSF
jgi:hypothetical protein